MTDDEKLAERIARAAIDERCWRRAGDWARRYVVDDWQKRIEAIRRAGLEIVERDDGR